MKPVVFAHATPIDDMRKVVLAVGYDEVCVCHSVVAVCRAGLRGYRHTGSALHRLYSLLGSCQADKPWIENIEPAAEHVRRVPRGISGYEHEFHLISNSWRELLQRSAERCHVHGTLI